MHVTEIIRKRFISAAKAIPPFNKCQQDSMSRSMQLHYTSVTAFSKTDSFLNRIYFKWDSRGSVITNHKTLIDVTALLDRTAFLSQKEKVY